MFTLKRNGKKVKTFESYEEARSAARKWIRKTMGVTEYNKLADKNGAMICDGVSRNPTNISIVGFNIVRA